MLVDEINIVLWKEWRELFLHRGGRPRWSLWSGLTLVFAFGAALPVLAVMGVRSELRGAAADLALQLVLVGMVVVALAAGVGLIVDAVAGERERHTLETLLATPLSDDALLAGKVLAIGLYAWVLGMLEGVVGMLTVLAAFGPARVDLPSAVGMTLIGLVSLLAALGLLLAGVLIGLRCNSVKQGQQLLMSLTFPIMLLLPVGTLFAQFGPLASLFDRLPDTGLEGTLLIVTGVLILIDLPLVAFARRAFRRDRIVAR